MPVQFEPIWVFFSAFAIASFGGVAAKLRGKTGVSCRQLFAAAMFSGTIGVCICLGLYNFFDARDNIPCLLAISGLAGIGGANVLDLIFLILGGKVKIILNIVPSPEVGKQGEEEEATTEILAAASKKPTARRLKSKRKDGEEGDK